MQNESHAGDNELYEKGGEMETEGDYEQGNYEMYEQMAMEYQSDVASQVKLFFPIWLPRMVMFKVLLL